MRPIIPTAVTITFVTAVLACGTHAPPNNRPNSSPSNSARPQPETGERHFGAIRQLTFGGENAEAYFSHDGKRLTYQARPGGQTCDQQFVMNVDGSHVRRVSNGFGKTTCGYFFDGDHKIFFGSTHGADSACPPRPDP